MACEKLGMAKKVPLEGSSKVSVSSHLCKMRTAESLSHPEVQHIIGNSSWDLNISPHLSRLKKQASMKPSTLWYWEVVNTGHFVSQKFLLWCPFPNYWVAVFITVTRTNNDLAGVPWPISPLPVAAVLASSLTLVVISGLTWHWLVLCLTVNVAYGIGIG